MISPQQAVCIEQEVLLWNAVGKFNGMLQPPLPRWKYFLNLPLASNRLSTVLQSREVNAG